MPTPARSRSDHRQKLEKDVFVMVFTVVLRVQPNKTQLFPHPTKNRFVCSKTSLTHMCYSRIDAKSMLHEPRNKGALHPKAPAM